jgi:hypothetical protein
MVPPSRTRRGQQRRDALVCRLAQDAGEVAGREDAAVFEEDEVVGEVADFGKVVGDEELGMPVRRWSPRWSTLTPYVQVLNTYDRRDVLFYFSNYSAWRRRSDLDTHPQTELNHGLTGKRGAPRLVILVRGTAHTAPTLGRLHRAYAVQKSSITWCLSRSLSDTSPCTTSH